MGVRSGIEVHGALEVAGDDDVAISIHRHLIARVGAAGAEAVRPHQVPGRVQFDHEDVIGALAPGLPAADTSGGVGWSARTGWSVILSRMKRALAGSPGRELGRE